jgi:hypothetical protein
VPGNEKHKGKGSGIRWAILKYDNQMILKEMEMDF